MDQEEIFPLSDTINLASSLDTDLEAHKAMEKGSEQDNIIEQTASIQCDVASQIESETREEGGDYDDINDENVNMQLIDTSKTAGKVQANTKRSNVASKEDLATRPCQFTLSRIKTIMKMDPEVSLASKESVFLVTKATELFTDFLAKEAFKFTSNGSRKTVQKKDIEQAVNFVDSLCFLDAALD